MPLLVIALMTHVVYRLMTHGWDWTTEASRKAWTASSAKTASLADRIRQNLMDKLDEWEKDPRAKGYAAWSVKAAGKTARGFGKGTLWTMLAAAKAAGAVTRALAGGAISTGGLLGALAQAVREGAANGASWWRRWQEGRGNKGSERAQKWAEKWYQWGREFPGEATENEPGAGGGQGQAGPEPDDSTWDTDWTTDHPGGSDGDQSQTGHTEPDNNRKPYQAGEATVGAPGGEQTSTPGPTPVSSSTAGTPAAVGAATAVLEDPPATAPKGDTVTTLVPTNGASLFPAGADGLQYEQAQNFLAEQARRAQFLADQVEQLVQLMAQILAAANKMQVDHANAQSGLQRFNVVAPNVNEAISMLSQICSIPAEDILVLMFQQLNMIESGCLADAADLSARFGAAWEATKVNNIDGSFYNG